MLVLARRLDQEETRDSACFFQWYMAQALRKLHTVRLSAETHSTDASVTAANGGLMQEVRPITPQLWGTP
jgi:hypothetical protein